MPYGKDFKPLTVYSEQNFEGTAVNDFGLEHTGGFMNSLSEKKLNNQIRSFKLKRGYMVTFATGLNGWDIAAASLQTRKTSRLLYYPPYLTGASLHIVYSNGMTQRKKDWPAILVKVLIAFWLPAGVTTGLQVSATCPTVNVYPTKSMSLGLQPQHAVAPPMLAT